MSTPPCVVAHADWSVTAQKRWLAVAIPTASSWQMRVEPVGSVGSLLERLRHQAAPRPVLFGVDAPIGLPWAYAVRHAGGRRDFSDFIAGLDPDSPFFSVCDDIGAVSGDRPFFPRTTRGSPRRQAQATALGVLHHDELLRQCDLKTADRPRSACLFWTLGPNQVGKAALSLWRELLVPALRAAEPPALWPFDGELHALLRTRAVTVAETYPAEALSRLKPRWRGSKRRQADRAALAGELRAWADRLQVEPVPGLGADIAAGFGPELQGEDRFDSMLGLLGMLAALREPGGSDVPRDATLRWEGWILGQRAR